MAREVATDDLLERIIYIGAIASTAAGSRHPSADILTEINQSYQRWRLKVSKIAKLPWFLTTFSDAMGTGAVSEDEPYTRIEPEIDLVWVRQISITVDGEIKVLEEVSTDAIGEYGADPDEPVAWTSEDNTTFLFLPPADQAYTYVIRYLPVAADRLLPGEGVDEEDTLIDGIAGFEDWIVFDVLINLMLRDDEPEMAMNFQGRRDEIWKDIMQHATKGRAGPHKRRDVRGARRHLSTRRRWSNG